MTIGLGCITAGTLLGGLLYQSGVASLIVGITVQSGYTAVGFLLVGWSLVRSEDTSDEARIQAS